MDVFLLRHGKAKQPSIREPSDHLRPLTISGFRSMEKIGMAIKKMNINPDILASSPLTRAVQTAEIVSRHINSDVSIWESLKPEMSHHAAAEAILASDLDSIMLVGHEPHLSDLASHMISGGEASISIKKGGLVCIDITPRNQNILRYVLTPRQMRMMC